MTDTLEAVFTETRPVDARGAPAPAPEVAEPSRSAPRRRPPFAPVPESPPPGEATVPAFDPRPPAPRAPR